MSWLLLSLRHWRLERASTASLGVLVLVTAFVGGVLPGIHERWAATALRWAVASAPVASRNLQLVQVGRIEPHPGHGFDSVELAGSDLEARLPDPVRALVGDRSALAESPRWAFVDPGPVPRTARFRFQPGVEEHLRLVAGRWPSHRFATIPGWLPKTFEVIGEPPPVGLFEAALGRTAAATIGARVGDILRLELDRSDPLVGTGFGGRIGQMAVRVVGLFEVADPADPFWFGDPRLDESVRRFVNLNVESEDVRLLLAPSAYERYMAETFRQRVPTSLTWRYVVDPARLSPRTVDALLVGLRQLGTVFRDPAGTPTNLRTNLLGIVEAEQAAFGGADVATTAAAMGPAVLAVACLATVAGLAARRRSTSLAIWRARGASSVHVVAAVIGEGLLALVPLGLGAGVLAVAMAPTDEPGPPLPVVVGVGVAVLAVGLAAGAALVVYRGLQGGAGRPSASVAVLPRPTPRRLVLEIALAGFAVVAAYLLRERGLVGSGSTGVVPTGPPVGAADGGPTAPTSGVAGGAGLGALLVDPILATVPLLLGLALGVLARHSIPLALRPMATLVGRGRGFLGAHAARRLAAAAGHGPVLLALVTATTVAGYSAAALSRLGAASEAAAWQTVGAPYRISRPNGNIPIGTDPSSLPGVVAVAAAYRAGAVTGTVAAPVEVLAVDTAAYRSILAATPFAASIPEGLERQGGEGTVPAIVGARLGLPPDDLSPGDSFTLVINGRSLTVGVLGLAPSLPTTAEDGRFVIVDRAILLAMGLDLPTTDLFVAAPPSAAKELARFVADRPGLVLADRAAEIQRLSAEPVAAGLTVALLGASVLAAGYAVTLLWTSMLIVSAGRSLEGGILAILGLSPSQRRRLVLMEYGPLLGAAAGFGLGAGIGLEAFLAAGLRLEQALGRPLPAGLAAELHAGVTIDPVWLVVLFVGSATIAGLGAWWAARAERPLAPAAILRGEVE